MGQMFPVFCKVSPMFIVSALRQYVKINSVKSAVFEFYLQSRIVYQEGFRVKWERCVQSRWKYAQKPPDPEMQLFNLHGRVQLFHVAEIRDIFPHVNRTTSWYHNRSGIVVTGLFAKDVKHYRQDGNELEFVLFKPGELHFERVSCTSHSKLGGLLHYQVVRMLAAYHSCKTPTYFNNCS